MDRILGRRAAIAILALGVLSGCATQLPRQAFNAQGALHVKRVIVVHHENQDEYVTAMLGHPAGGFGLIGGLLAAADMQSKTNKFTAAVKPGETRLQERFGQKLKAKLGAAGYEAEVVVVPAGKSPDEAIAEAKKRGQGDAVIAVYIVGSYLAAGPTTDYFPRLQANVKKVDARSDKVLYQDQISYGYVLPHAQTVHLASPEAYRFKDIEVLVGEVDKAREGLYMGVDALVHQIASDLKK